MSIVHVVPTNDLREHNEQNADCWCEPKVLDEGVDDNEQPVRVIVHNSADHRERHEGQN